MTYGYYTIKNRSQNEASTMNILEGKDSENDFFSNHPEYKKAMYKDKIGIDSLTLELSNRLIKSITESLPEVMAKINELDSIVTNKLDIIGRELPESLHGKLAIINGYVTNFSRCLTDSMETSKKIIDLNVGKEIKDIFVRFRRTLPNIRPFDNRKIYNDDYFTNIASSFEGNH